MYCVDFCWGSRLRLDAVKSICCVDCWLAGVGLAKV
jgi:hypothetical protein